MFFLAYQNFRHLFLNFTSPKYKIVSLKQRKADPLFEPLVTELYKYENLPIKRILNNMGVSVFKDLKRAFETICLKN